MFSGPTSRITARPSISGIWTSRKTRSGRVSRRAATASRPSFASWTAATSGSPASSRRRPWRASGSSSTINRVQGMDLHHLRRGLSRHGAIGKDQGGDGAAASAVFELHPRRLAVELAQAGPRVRQADPLRSGASGRQAGPVVLDPDLQEVPHPRGVDPQPARRGAAPDPMADRVLHDRLQSQMGDGGVEDLGPGVDLHPQAVLEADLLDREIEPQGLELAPQGDLLGLDVVEHAAQEIAQAGEHLLRLRPSPLAHQHHDGVQGVEQEMRLELAFESGELRLHELRPELGALELQPQRLPPLLLILVVITERVLEAQHGPVRHHVGVKSQDREQEKRRAEAGLHERRKDPQPRKDGAARREVYEQKDKAGRKRDQPPPQPDLPLEGEPAAEPEDGGRERGDEIDPDDPGDERAPPGDGDVPQEIPRGVLREVEEPGPRPRQEDEAEPPQRAPIDEAHWRVEYRSPEPVIEPAPAPRP